MLGMIRLRIAPKEPRARVERTEVIGRYSFLTSVLQLQSTEKLVDRMMIRQSLRFLSISGVSAVAAPSDPYIKMALERYNMEQLGHTALLRAMAPQIMDRLLGRRPDAAVLLYARRLDKTVLEAVYHAAQHYSMVMLDFGRYGESVRRRLMDEMGAAVLIGQVHSDASRAAALFFDPPPTTYTVRMRGAVTVALCEGVCADYNEIQVCPGILEPLDDTDREAVICVAASDDASLYRAVTLGSLLKK